MFQFKKILENGTKRREGGKNRGERKKQELEKVKGGGINFVGSKFASLFFY